MKVGGVSSSGMLIYPLSLVAAGQTGDRFQGSTNEGINPSKWKIRTYFDSQLCLHELSSMNCDKYSRRNRAPKQFPLSILTVEDIVYLAVLKTPE
jgi:hypothetical protein